MECFTWGQDNAVACGKVRATQAFFKVLLKTRNEYLLIDRWLRHYLDILGPQGQIIVLDNMSTDKRVFDAYQRHADNIVLIQYDGKVDSAHSPARFGDLYEAVRESAAFYSLLDTDEFLCLYEGGTLEHANVLPFLQERQDGNIFPSLYLHNLYGRDDAFFFEPKNLRSYHLQGKPVLSSAAMRAFPGTPVGHNMDVPLRLFEKHATGLVLLHMTNLSREQRIKANMQKLVNFGLLKSEQDFATVLHADEKAIRPAYLRRYVHELRWLLPLEDEEALAQSQQSREHVETGPDGSLRFCPATLADPFMLHAGPDQDLLELLEVRPPEGPPSHGPEAGATRTLQQAVDKQ
jgi:hypothetical protein